MAGRRATHDRLRAKGFARVWAQADRASPMTELERARFLLRRLYPDLEGARLDAIMTRLEAEWHAGTWTGFVRPSQELAERGAEAVDAVPGGLRGRQQPGRSAGSGGGAASRCTSSRRAQARSDANRSRSSHSSPSQALTPMAVADGLARQPALQQAEVALAARGRGARTAGQRQQACTVAATAGAAASSASPADRRPSATTGARRSSSYQARLVAATSAPGASAPEARQHQVEQQGSPVLARERLPAASAGSASTVGRPGARRRPARGSPPPPRSGRRPRPVASATAASSAASRASSASMSARLGGAIDDRRHVRRPRRPLEAARGPARAAARPARRRATARPPRRAARPAAATGRRCRRGPRRTPRTRGPGTRRATATGRAPRPRATSGCTAGRSARRGTSTNIAGSFGEPEPLGQRAADEALRPARRLARIGRRLADRAGGRPELRVVDDQRARRPRPVGVGQHALVHAAAVGHEVVEQEVVRLGEPAAPVEQREDLALVPLDEPRIRLLVEPARAGTPSRTSRRSPRPGRGRASAARAASP